MKLTEDKLRQIIREELNRITEGDRVKLDKLKKKHENLRVVSPDSYPGAYEQIENYLEQEGYATRMFDFYVIDDPSKPVDKMKIWQGSGNIRRRSSTNKHVMTLQEQDDMFGADKYLNQFQQYLSSTGREVGRQGLSYDYKGYHVSLEPVDYYMEVTLYRDKNDREAVASARIEDDAVRLKRPDPGQGQVGRRGQMPRPQTQNVRYKSPEQVMHRLVSLAEA